MPAFDRREFIKRSAILSGALLAGSQLRLLAFPLEAPALVPVSRAFFSMGSVLDMLVYGESRLHCLDATEKVFAEFNHVDRIMSVFEESSQLSMINTFGYHQAVRVDSSIIEALNVAKRYTHLTGGAFDVTVEPLMKLYGFRDDRTDQPFPTDREVGSALEAVGMENVISNEVEGTVQLTSEKTQIDFGGIAVGYAMDRAIGVLRKEGIRAALINHSGDVYALGSPPDAEGWKIGIANPINPEETICSVCVTDQALSTSGSYQKARTMDGKTIGHILDPRTGQPATKTLSMTVVATSATAADAYSTGLFVTGLEAVSRVLGGSEVSHCYVVVEEDGRPELLEF